MNNYADVLDVSVSNGRAEYDNVLCIGRLCLASYYANRLAEPLQENYTSVVQNGILFFGIKHVYKFLNSFIHHDDANIIN